MNPYFDITPKVVMYCGLYTYSNIPWKHYRWRWQRHWCKCDIGVGCRWCLTKKKYIIRLSLFIRSKFVETGQLFKSFIFFGTLYPTKLVKSTLLCLDKWRNMSTVRGDNKEASIFFNGSFENILRMKERDSGILQFRQ